MSLIETSVEKERADMEQVGHQQVDSSSDKIANLQAVEPRWMRSGIYSKINWKDHKKNEKDWSE